MKTDKGSFWIASRIGLLHGTDQWILMEDLNMWHISVKSVPRLLTYKQKQWCVFVCQEDEVKITKTSSKGQNRRQNLCLHIRLRNLSAVLSVEKPVHSISKDSEASQALLSRGFTKEGSKFMKTSRMMAEPGLVNSSWQGAGTPCSQYKNFWLINYNCGPPSNSLLTWLDPS